MHRGEEKEGPRERETHGKRGRQRDTVYARLLLVVVLLAAATPVATADHLGRARAGADAERAVDARAHAAEAHLPALEALLNRGPVLRRKGLDGRRARDGERARGLREAAEEERRADGCGRWRARGQ